MDLDSEPKSRTPGSAEITAAVCTFNRYELLGETIRALCRQSLPRGAFEILIVDNSTDREAAQTFYNSAMFGPDVRIVWSNPPGLSRARNCAIENCTTPYIAFLDDDAIPEPGWLAALADTFRRDSRTAAAGGPIRPIWSGERPDWLPERYLGLLTIHEPFDGDRELNDGQYLYGANMAFRVDSLRQGDGFPEQIGRNGASSLLSNEELRIQDLLRARGEVVRYVAAAAVRHRVHEDRLRRNWMRSRMAWQAVSEQLGEPAQFHRDWTTGELRDLATRNSDVAAAVRLLLAPVSGEALSEQLSAAYHLLALLLGVHTMEDSEVEGWREALLEGAAADRQVAVAPPRAHFLPVSDAYAPSSAGGAGTRHLFVEGAPGHRYLYDLYGDLPQSHLVTYPASDAWNSDAGSIAAYRRHLDFVFRSLGPDTKNVFFITLDQALGGAQREDLLRFITACPARVHGILHRLPQSSADLEVVRRFGQLMGSVCFLSETMADHARSVLRLPNARYLPHHATSYVQSCPPARRADLRASLGIPPDRVVLSMVGEARHGKGIDLLMDSLPHIPVGARNTMFFLIAGKARHYKAEELRTRLITSRTAGVVDLRDREDDLQYSVLSEREYADYVAISDIGLLLYKDDQRNCMSGVLGDYVWAGRPVLATDNSYTGSEVHRNDLGLLLRTEKPEALAVLLVEALRTARHWEPPAAARAYRDQTAPSAVLTALGKILESPV